MRIIPWSEDRRQEFRAMAIERGSMGGGMMGLLTKRVRSFFAARGTGEATDGVFVILLNSGGQVMARIQLVEGIPRDEEIERRLVAAADEIHRISGIPIVDFGLWVGEVRTRWIRRRSEIVPPWLMTNAPLIACAAHEECLEVDEMAIVCWKDQRKT